VPDTFFTSSPSHTAAFAAPTWVVQLETTGKRKVYHYPNGFRFLSFRNTNGAHLVSCGQFWHWSWVKN